MSELPSIERLRKLLAEATQGPWAMSLLTNEPWETRGLIGRSPSEHSESASWATLVNGTLWKKDAILIAEMRNALDALLDVVEAAQGIIGVLSPNPDPEEQRLLTALARFTREES